MSAQSVYPEQHARIMTGYTDYVQLPILYQLLYLRRCVFFIGLACLEHRAWDDPRLCTYHIWLVSFSVKSLISAYEGPGGYVWESTSSSLLFCPDHRQSLSCFNTIHHRQQIDPSFVQQLWLTRLLFIPGESIIWLSLDLVDYRLTLSPCVLEIYKLCHHQRNCIILYDANYCQAAISMYMSHHNSGAKQDKKSSICHGFKRCNHELQKCSMNPAHPGHGARNERCAVIQLHRACV